MSLSDKIIPFAYKRKDDALCTEDVKEFIQKNREIDSDVIDLLEKIMKLTIDRKHFHSELVIIAIENLIKRIKNKDKEAGEKLT